jgi:formate dehydrogenase maturation protein FdhE
MAEGDTLDKVALERYSRRQYCPECGSEDVSDEETLERYQHSRDGRTGVAEIHCNRCGCEWNEVYRLAYVEVITAGEKEARDEYDYEHGFSGD